MHHSLRISLAIAAAGIILGSAGGCGKEQKKEVAERETRVTLQPLQKRIFQRRIPVQGTVWPVEYATISAKISGTLELLKVDEGDVRKQGDLLFGIDRQILKNQVTLREDEIKVKQAELESAKIALESAKILEEKATIDYKRSLTLWSSKATSQSELETYETNYKKAETDVNNAKAAIVNAEAQLKQAEGNLIIARKNLDDSVVYAPFDCVVTDKYVEENEYVSTGQNILKLENQQKLEVICYISAVYYDLVKAGSTPVHFALDGVDQGEGSRYLQSAEHRPRKPDLQIQGAGPSRHLAGQRHAVRPEHHPRREGGVRPADGCAAAAGEQPLYRLCDRSRKACEEFRCGPRHRGRSLLRDRERAGTAERTFRGHRPDLREQRVAASCGR